MESEYIGEARGVGRGGLRGLKPPPPPLSARSSTYTILQAYDKACICIVELTFLLVKVVFKLTFKQIHRQKQS